MGDLSCLLCIPPLAVESRSDLAGARATLPPPMAPNNWETGTDTCAFQVRGSLHQHGSAKTGLKRSAAKGSHFSHLPPYSALHCRDADIAMRAAAPQERFQKLVVEANGFVFMNEPGKDGRKKWGYVANTTGAELKFKVRAWLCHSCGGDGDGNSCSFGGGRHSHKRNRCQVMVLACTYCTWSSHVQHLPPTHLP
jgi:hypothetical protein